MIKKILVKLMSFSGERFNPKTRFNEVEKTESELAKEREKETQERMKQRREGKINPSSDKGWQEVKIPEDK
jgi:hypothetical protein